LPRVIEVRTSATLAPSNFSMARRMSI